MGMVSATEFLNLLQAPINEGSVSSLRVQSEKTVKLSGSETLIADYKQKIKQASQKIGANDISSKHQSNLFHSAYGFASKIYWSLFYDIPDLNQEKKNILNEFKEKNYHVFSQERANIINGHLKPIFSRLSEFNQTLHPDFKPQNVTRKGYAVGKRLPNQIPIENLTQLELGNVNNLFKKTGIGDIISNYYQSNFGASQIRIWRYLSPGNKSKDHYVGAHFDGLPPWSFKLMMFDGNITPRHGCFEVVRKKKNLSKPVLQLIGENPCAMLIPNIVFHRALAPDAGFHRDTIEITIQPYLGDSPIYVDAGCIAGNPINPFSNWAERV